MIRVGFVSLAQAEPCDGCAFPTRRVLEVTASPNGRTPASALHFCRLCARQARALLVALPSDMKLPRRRALPSSKPN